MPTPEATESRVRSMLGGMGAEPAAEPDADDEAPVDAEAMTLEAAAADLIAAQQAGDAGGVARAFSAMFDAKMGIGPE